MAISEKNLKKLWGLAAGRCSRPGCEELLIKFLCNEDPTVIGEMAHVISRKAGGPRGVSGGGDDSYENLILLCPTHHTEVDKAPKEVFTATVLHEWKQKHEENIRQVLQSPRYADRTQLATTIKRLLIANKAAWQQFGPDSKEAIRNPLSSSHKIWTLKKLSTIVPNNRKIICIIERNQDLFDMKDFPSCMDFVQHAEGFEGNCYIRAEGIPRFPTSFEEVIDRYAKIQ